MKIYPLYFTLLLSIALPISSGNAAPITRQFILDERIPYSIPVAHRQGVTTFLFPAAPSAFYGKNIVRSGTEEESNPNAQFSLSYKPGNNYFSIRALKPDSRDILTVIYQRNAYQLEIFAAPENPLYTVTFLPPNTRTGKAKAGVFPSQLLGLLDKAKAFPLFAKYHPESLDRVTRVQPARIILYRGFRVLIDEVFRFDDYDTLVFRILFHNQTDEPIYYQPQALAVRVGDRIYTASISDASGIMPPRSITPAYFAITGNANGNANYLSADNRWNVLVSRVLPPPEASRFSKITPVVKRSASPGKTVSP
jgi:hypothetical protein